MYEEKPELLSEAVNELLNIKRNRKLVLEIVLYKDEWLSVKDGTCSLFIFNINIFLFI